MEKKWVAIAFIGFVMAMVVGNIFSESAYQTETKAKYKAITACYEALAKGAKVECPKLH
ncbi:MAG: hypothetical protein WAX89_06225 [Alphaproteobacteria bacterium]